jgi:hypothetical protein
MLEETEGARCSGKKANDQAHERAQQLFADLDRDGDGSISMQEFVDGYIRYLQLTRSYLMVNKFNNNNNKFGYKRL